MSPAMKAGAPHTLEDFMAQALAMEREAVERYTEFADAMEVHNNREVAAMFRTMAQLRRQACRADHGRRWAGPATRRRPRAASAGPTWKPPRRCRSTRCTT